MSFTHSHTGNPMKPLCRRSATAATVFPTLWTRSSRRCVTDRTAAPKIVVVLYLWTHWETGRPKIRLLSFTEQTPMFLTTRSGLKDPGTGERSLLKGRKTKAHKTTRLIPETCPFLRLYYFSFVGLDNQLS